MRFTKRHKCAIVYETIEHLKRGVSTMHEKKKEDWEGKHFSFFSNRECEYFPCHKGVDPEEFNCLFCYCPLYALGEECGGGFKILQNGVKDCSGCTLPHQKENYGKIIKNFEKILDTSWKKVNRS